MSSNTSALGLTSYIRPTLPIITGLLNVLGLGGGIFSLLDSRGGAAGFGISLPASPSPIETAYARVHGIRNVGNAITSLALLTYLQFSDFSRMNPLVEMTLRKVIGISLIVGTTVAFGDGLILKRLAEASATITGAEKAGRMSEVKRLADEKAPGHMIIALPIALLGVAWLTL